LQILNSKFKDSRFKDSRFKDSERKLAVGLVTNDESSWQKRFKDSGRKLAKEKGQSINLPAEGGLVG
jgi:hypothetical protein